MTWILTASGKRLDFANPQPHQIDILDIAQGLANECRYSGQCKTYYSVAQHCVIASHIVALEFALEALLHDAAEAYLKDIPSPLKRLLPEYRAIEHKVMAAIRTKFNLPAEESPQVKKADTILLKTEKRDLMPEDDSDWGISIFVRPLATPIRTVHSGIAQSQFIKRFVELTKG